MFGFKALPGPVQGILSILMLTVNTVFWTVPLFVLTFMKMIVPIPAWRRLCGQGLNVLALGWILCNNIGIRLTKPIEWDVSGITDLSVKESYLVIANHQSWLDIVVLQKVFFGKIPFLKFFLKKQLIWVPLLGQAWWALDFPFMKRYSRDYLKKHPEHKGRDLETTRKACAKFKNMPVSIMNFVEGTRFTKDKALAQGSPYRHLLRPKAAGIAFVLGSMGENLTSILNVTIAYTERARSLWAFMCGRVSKIKVVVERLPVTPELLGDYFQDLEFQKRFQGWINELWDQKENLIHALTQDLSETVPAQGMGGHSGKASIAGLGEAAKTSSPPATVDVTEVDRP